MQTRTIGRRRAVIVALGIAICVLPLVGLLHRQRLAFRRKGFRLIWAVSMTRDFEAAKKLIEEDPGLVIARDHREGFEGWTPLHWAAWTCQERCASFLISSGAPVGIMSDAGITPVDFAQYYPNSAIPRLLLDNGAEADPFVYSSLGMVGRVREALIADPELTNKYSETGDTLLLRACATDRLAMVKCLVSSGADVGLASKENRYTSLHRAAMHGNGELVRLLLEEGAGVNARCAEGYTALYYAKGNVHEGAAIVLRENGGTE